MEQQIQVVILDRNAYLCPEGVIKQLSAYMKCVLTGSSGLHGFAMAIRFLISASLPLLFFIILDSRPCLAIDRIEVGDDRSPQFTPYAIDSMRADQVQTDRWRIRNPIQVYKMGRGDLDTSIYCICTNTALYQDCPADLSLWTYPNRSYFFETPVYLTITDYGFFQDIESNSRAIACGGFRNDSAYVFKIVPSTNGRDSCFIASGKDQTGNGQWSGEMEYMASIDLDWDGEQEVLFWLNPGRDRTPRLLVCINMSDMHIKWKLPVASGVIKESIIRCGDSTEPGVIFASYGMGQGVRDSNFFSSFGYLTRVDAKGSIVWNKIVADFGREVRLLKTLDDSIMFLSHNLPFLQDETVSLASSTLSKVTTSGRVLQSIATDSDVYPWYWDYVGDGLPEIYTVDSKGNVRVFDRDLQLLAQSEATSLNKFWTLLPSWGESKGIFVLAGPMGLESYNHEFKKLSLIGFYSEVSVLALDENGNASAFVASDRERCLVGRIRTRPWHEVITVFYVDNRNYILVGGLGLLLSFIVASFYHNRTRINLQLISRQKLELERTQAALVESSVREASHRAHRDLIGSIAHRIRNSMSLATMNTQTLKRKFGDELPPRAKEMLEQIGDSLKLTSENIEAFTTYEKIEQEVSRDPVKVKAVLDRVIAGYRSALDEHKITVRVNCPVELTAPANEKHIYLVIENLVKNSLEALTGGGKIVIALAAEGYQLTLSYQDSGPGIPEEVLEKLGKRIVSTKPTAGLGIGVLSIFEVFKVYGGTIEYANRPEGGVRVIGRLPLAKSSKG